MIKRINKNKNTGETDVYFFIFKKTFLYIEHVENHSSNLYDSTFNNIDDYRNSYKSFNISNNKNKQRFKTI